MITKILLAVMVAVIGTTEASGNAVEDAARLHEQADAARKSGDLKARLAIVLQARALLHDSSDMVASTAVAYAQAGDNAQAVAMLEEFAGMGLADDDVTNHKAFAALAEEPAFVALRKRFAENKTPVSNAETAFVLLEPGSINEDIDFDPKSKTFFVSCVLGKKIIRVHADGKAEDFAPSPSHWPVLALKIDAQKRLLWATEVGVDDFIAVPKSDWGKTALLCYDLETAKLLHRYEGPVHTALNDLMLTPEGVPIMSDSTGAGLYGLEGDHLARLDQGDFISPQTAAMHPDGKRFLVPDYARGIAIFDPVTKQAAWLTPGEKPAHALNGIDGLYRYGDTLLATQNGTFPERVVAFSYDAKTSAITSEHLIERATKTLGDPTHGVIVDDTFYYIANSGWGYLNERGEVKPGVQPTAARVMRFPLGKLNK